MRRRRTSENVQALRSEARGLVAGVHYAMSLDPGQRALWAHDRLVEVARRLGLPAPPDLPDVIAGIDGWAAECGLRTERRVS